MCRFRNKKLINMKVRNTLILALNYSLFGQNTIKMGFSLCTPEESLKMQDWVFRMGWGSISFVKKSRSFQSVATAPATLSFASSSAQWTKTF